MNDSTATYVGLIMDSLWLIDLNTEIQRLRNRFKEAVSKAKALKREESITDQEFRRINDVIQSAVEYLVSAKRFLNARRGNTRPFDAGDRDHLKAFLQYAEEQVDRAHELMEQLEVKA